MKKIISFVLKLLIKVKLSENHWEDLVLLNPVILDLIKIKDKWQRTKVNKVILIHPNTELNNKPVITEYNK